MWRFWQRHPVGRLMWEGLFGAPVVRYIGPSRHDHREIAILVKITQQNFRAIFRSRFDWLPHNRWLARNASCVKAVT